jgi:hypothetical protein
MCYSRMISREPLLMLDLLICVMEAVLTIVHSAAVSETMCTRQSLVSRWRDPVCEDDCINQDKGRRCVDGRSKSKRTWTTQALTSHKICPFSFRVRWDQFGFYIATNRQAGCPTHCNHLSDGLDKLTLPIKLLPVLEQETL